VNVKGIEMAQTNDAAAIESDAVDLMKSIVAALEKAPKSALDQSELETIYAGAYAELQAERFEQAQRMFLFLNSQAPLDPRFSEGLGIAYLRLSDYAKSIPFLGLASYLRPTSPVPLLHMAEAMAGMGELKGAGALLSASAALADLEPRFSDVGRKARARLELLNGQPA
jgi:tetratricopeptide (TPR) repeat protein